ncbi:TIGR03016 family PEP-CTERM system-associated outer membrane protein [Massilia sp. BJB1822]|uniref:TIGR03016 family PEP-CTERM system-associated outer membrane protein n=1 Tax=Massilia sp. BJB1822 TaxID=2744470 RepID=UPI0015945A9A|nr:TIGR03016 family PEP-CTERM system-associated outer membrane protein [Massilia sp. BJB1822]NVD96939.1 TIGR03016 family PEP-CTERM system-associated outer membrane protein [Massilia sp. BJB1822]
MTTTMAKRCVPAALPKLAPMALALLMAAPAARAEWKFAPALELRETWSDNVGLASNDKAGSQFITEVVPGFSLTNVGPRLKLHANYQLHLYQYSKERVGGTGSNTSSLNAGAQAKVVDDLLFFDGTATISQQATSAFGPQVNNNGYSTNNRNEVRTIRLSPYLQHRFGSTAQMELRYTRDTVDTDNRGMGRSDANSINLNINSGPAFRTIGWGFMANRQVLDDSIAPTSTTQLAMANVFYRLTPTFSLTASGGYDKFSYESNGQATQGKSWSTGFRWNPSPRTSLDASLGKRYYGNSYSLALNHRARYSNWSVSYGDSVTNSRSNFLLPSAIDTATMLDRLFMPNFPDAAKRAAAVEAYIRALNLPRALPDSVNYFSNRYALQKQLQASVSFTTARTSTMFNIFSMRREALSLTQVDSALLGSSSGNVNDNTRQTGASALFNYRLNSRTGASLSATYTNADSNSLGKGSQNRALRLFLTHQFDQKISGGMEVRRVRGSTFLDSGNYTENAVAASVSIKL